MGQLRFVAPDWSRLPAGAVDNAYLTGMEGVPFPSRNLREGDQLVIHRDVRESGNFNILWQVPERGPLMLSTACLMERAKPYWLPIELARGTLHRLRNQQWVWHCMGLTTPESYRSLEREAMLAFARAVTMQSQPELACEEAQASIVCALEAGQALAAAYVEQVLALRHEQTDRLPTLLGSRLPAELTDAATSTLTSSFNTAVVPLTWSTLEPAEGEFDWTASDAYFQWLKGKSLKVCSGPLVRLDAGWLPDWMYLWEDDFDSIHSYLQQYLTAVVQRYRGQVHVWHCAAGLNMPGELGMSEEEKLRLAVLAIDAVRRADPRTPVIVSFDQPWGEYLREDEMDLPPFHFADALVRADLGLSGVGLELNMGYAQGGTLPRDVLELSRLIDRWSTLGVPLLTFLTAPSSSQSDPLASHNATTVHPQITPELQAEWLEPWLSVLVAKQTVHGLFWNQFTDNEPHRWPHSGLFDVNGTAKPIAKVLAALKTQHLS